MPIGTEEVVVGRAEGCSLQIIEPYVSGRHCSLQLRAFVRDLGSRNGTHFAGKRVNEQVLAHQESIHVGGPDGARLTLDLAGESPDHTLTLDTAPAAQPDVERGERAVPARSESAPMVEGSEREIARLREELKRVRADLEARERSPAAGGDTMTETQFLARLGEVQEKLNRESAARRDAEARLAALAAASAPGGQETQRLLAERDKTIRELNEAVADARRRAEAPAASGSAASGGSAQEGAAGFLTALTRSGDVGLEEAVIEMMVQRRDMLSDGGFLLGKMYRFSRDLEGVITRMAQHYRGGVADADVTMIPGVRGNLSRSVHGLLLRGGDKARKELDDYLEQLRAWAGICLTAYKSGAAHWCRKLLLDIAPDAIQRAARVSPWKKALALDAWEYWRSYRKHMDDITPDLAEAQIDEYAANAAVDLAKKKGVW